MNLDGQTIALLVTGAVRVAIFVYGARWACRYKRASGVAGFGLAAITATVFTLSNAGLLLDNDDVLVQIAAILSTPTAALMVAAFVLAPVRHDEGDRWRL